MRAFLIEAQQAEIERATNHAERDKDTNKLEHLIEAMLESIGRPSRNDDPEIRRRSMGSSQQNKSKETSEPTGYLLVSASDYELISTVVTAASTAPETQEQKETYSLTSAKTNGSVKSKDEENEPPLQVLCNSSATTQVSSSDLLAFDKNNNDGDCDEHNGTHIALSILSAQLSGNEAILRPRKNVSR